MLKLKKKLCIVLLEIKTSISCNHLMVHIDTFFYLKYLIAIIFMYVSHLHSFLLTNKYKMCSNINF